MSVCCVVICSRSLSLSAHVTGFFVIAPLSCKSDKCLHACGTIPPPPTTSPQLFTSPIISFFSFPRAFIQPFFSARHLQNSWKTSRPILVSCSFKRTGLNCHQWLFSLGFPKHLKDHLFLQGDLAKTGPGRSLGQKPQQRPKLHLSPHYRVAVFRPAMRSWP